jgi:hypothetical protein
MKKLLEIQAELKCPKGSLNKFGNYKYRSAEQILESVKPLLAKHGAVLRLSDSIEQVGNKLFLKAVATFSVDNDCLQVSGWAELGEHKGMSSEQCTGTASSYARKYALNGLFLIDETESDPDSKDNTKTINNPDHISIKKEIEKAKNPEKNEKKPISAEHFQKAIVAIQKGDYSVEELKARFELNELQEKALLLL